MTRIAIAASLAVLLLAPTARAQGTRVGSMAPEIRLDEWIGVAPGEEPTSASLRGKVMMVEFWGTWCAPCVHSMPHVQELHDRYSELGLVVLAISNEPRELVETFVRKNGYTMRFGCDPEAKVVGAFGVAQWPTTYVIDETGRVVYVGYPSEAEPAIERALGLPADAAGSLNAYARALRGGDAEAARTHLRRLVDQRPRAFDLARWARVAPGSAGAVAQAGAGERDPTELLERALDAFAAGGETAAAESFATLAASDARRFDLLAWARASLRGRWPLGADELAAELAARRHAEVVEALLHRCAAPELVERAAADADFAAYCARRAPDARSRAKKGLMLEHWVFAGVEPANGQAFWSDLGVGGLQRAGARGIPGRVTIGSEVVTAASAEGFTDEELRLSLALTSLASGRAPASRGVEATVAAQRRSLLESLRSRYGEAK